MGIIVNQDDNRTELQKRIAEQLNDKARKKPDVLADSPDGVEDSAFVKDLAGSKATMWVWWVLGLVVIAVFVYLYITAGN